MLVLEVVNMTITSLVRRVGIGRAAGTQGITLLRADLARAH
jgi:hypothetical protein